MTNEKAIMCLEDMRIKVPIPKAAKQARENNEALDVAIKALKNEPHWIPVTERLPEKNGAYLVTAEGFPVSIKFYSADSYGWGEEWRRVITAWMPKPEPYKGGVVTT